MKEYECSVTFELEHAVKVKANSSEEAAKKINELFDEEREYFRENACLTGVWFTHDVGKETAEDNELWLGLSEEYGPWQEV